MIDPVTAAKEWLKTPAGAVLSRKACEYAVRADVAEQKAIAEGKDPGRVLQCRKRYAAYAAVADVEREAVRAWLIATYGRDALDWDTVSDVIVEARRLTHPRAAGLVE